MKKAAKKAAKKGSRKSSARISESYYLAILRQKPTASLVEKVEWVKRLLGKPDFKVVEIDGGKVNVLECSLSRGTFKKAADMVCWVNKDNQQHKIQFLNARWPFDPALNDDNESVTVPAHGASAWYRISSKSGSPGLSVPYEYGVDVPPGPPGPVIISDD
jgi:hypothetical protein